MPRVLLISPHFPPDSSAGTHRARLLAPHLHEFGWIPTVLTVEPSDYEGRLEPGLTALLPDDLEVVRVHAWPAQSTRRFGVGDLGLRACMPLYRAAAKMLSLRRYDALFITIYPTYPALLGPLLKRRFGVPFVLDYQDPWVGSWGLKVGGGRDGSPDWKSRASRAVSVFLEPRAARAADAITAVSRGTIDEMHTRNPSLRSCPSGVLPIGYEPDDFSWLRSHPRENRFFRRDDGNVHFCAVGTLLPLGMETLRALFGAVQKLRSSSPALYARLRLHFFGTSNQLVSDAPARALPVAREFGVEDVVSEVAPRLDYLDALTIQMEASALLLLGSSEPHYTASRIFPAVASHRPLLAIYHRASSVVSMLSELKESCEIVSYDDVDRATSRIDEIAASLVRLADTSVAPIRDLGPFAPFTASAIAGSLSALFDRVSGLSTSREAQ